MINKKWFLILSIMLISFKTIIPKDNEINFRLIIDTWSHPFYYESMHNMYCTSFNGSIMAGLQLNQFTIGIEVFEDYYSHKAKDDIYNYKGSWNIVKGCLNAYFKPIKLLEFKWGIGGGWYKSAFSKDDVGTIAKNEGGLSLLFEATINPNFDYIDLRLINRMDIFFTSLSASPNYYGGLRCNFHPLVNWFNLYIEVGGMNWIYSGSPVEINTGVFLWTVGFSMDISFPKSIDYTKSLLKKEKEINNENKKIYKQNIEKLKKGKAGDIITFTDIIFNSDSDIIINESLNIIDEIAKILKERVEINIEITGHTNDIGKAKQELELSRKRAEMVKKKLVERGIDAKRIKTLGFGSLYTKSSTVDEANRRVEIKISKNNLF